MRVATSILAKAFDVVTIGLARRPASSEGGLLCLPHDTIAIVDPADAAGMTTPGAAALRSVVESAPQSRLSRAFDASAMVRTQIGLTEEEYVAAKREARRLGISLAELLRRSLRHMLPADEQRPWMRYAGLIESGDAASSLSRLS